MNFQDHKVLYKVCQFQSHRHRIPVTIMYFLNPLNASWALEAHDCKVQMVMVHKDSSEYRYAAKNSSLPSHFNDERDYGHLFKAPEEPIAPMD